MRHIVITKCAAIKAGDTFKLEHEPLVRDWKDFCHDSRYRQVAMLVDFNETRDRSRWTVERRARPFTIKFADTLDIVSSSSTLAGAIKIAQKWAEARAAVAARRAIA